MDTDKTNLCIKFGRNCGYARVNNKIEIYASEDDLNRSLGVLIWLDPGAEMIRLSDKEIAELEEEE